MNAISGLKPDEVWAVGEESGEAALPHSLVVRFDGASWSRVAVPNIRWLRDVAAVAPSEVWAVGHRRLLHLTDGQWGVVHLPHVPRLQLHAVGGSGRNDVWVVGTQRGARLPANSIGRHTVALHWNGSRWRTTPTPNIDHRSNELVSVFAESPRDAWAVGNAVRRGLALHWDGIRWAVVPVPHELRSRRHVRLDGVGSDGAGGVWVVGNAGGRGYGQPVYLLWAGDKWRTRFGSPAGEIAAPTAVSSNGAETWAAGSRWSSDYSLASYRGGTWHALEPAIVGVDRGAVTLNDVLTLSPALTWATGTTLASGTDADPYLTLRALLIRWDGERWRPTPIEGVATPGL